MRSYRGCLVLLSLGLLVCVSGAQAEDSPIPGDADLSGLQQGEFRFKTDSTDSGQLIDYGIIVLPENREKQNSR